MRPAALFTMAAAIATASAGAVPTYPVNYPREAEAEGSIIQARDCPSGLPGGTDRKHGEFWTGPSNATPSGGCAWYTCVGTVRQLWINCGGNACTKVNGQPTCAW